MSTEIAFDGQVAIVTGAGKGLGREYALELAGRGARVVVDDIDRPAADAVAAEIHAAGGTAVAVYEDVRRSEGGAAMVAAAVEHFGTVDIVVANAGTMRNGPIDELTGDDLDEMLAVHVGGCFHVTRAAWPIMREKGHGRVILVSSAGGMFGMQTISNYSAAKAGVYGLTRALAIEGRPLGITVNALLPSAKTTIMSAEKAVPGYTEDFPAELRERLMPRRTAETVAPMVAFLASPACELNGETLSATCGRYARVVVALTDGWVPPVLADVRAEDLAEHIDAIMSDERYTVPFSLFDEYAAIGQTLDAQPAPR